jgi:hypothetical protein
MLFPPARLFVVAATLMVASGACSTSSKRDQYYGTDVGADWVPPDGGLLSRDAASGDAEAGADGAADTAGPDAADGGADALDSSSADALTGDTL